MPSVHHRRGSHDAKENELSEDLKTRWKAKGVHDVVLEDGTNVGLRLPNITDCIIAGEIPMPVITRLQRPNGDKPVPEPEPITTEDLQHDRRYQAEMIRASVATFEGEPIILTLEDVAELPEEHRTEIFAYASRAKPLPKAS
jgi:hypothetical protein